MTRSRVKNDFAVGLTTDSIGRLTTDHTITSGGSIVIGADGSITGSEGAQIDLRGNDGTATVYYVDVAGTPEVARIFTVTDDTDLQIGQLGGTGGDVQFYAGGSRKARFDSDGLKFNNDTAATNALDDYEEGTWDCHLRDTATGNIVVSDTATNGRYVKIGRQITVYVLLYANGVSSYTFSGSPYFALPVATANSGGGTCSALDVRYLLNLSTAVTAYNEQNSTRLLLATSVASPANNVASGITLSGNVRLYGCISYQTA